MGHLFLQILTLLFPSSPPQFFLSLRLCSEVVAHINHVQGWQQEGLNSKLTGTGVSFISVPNHPWHNILLHICIFPRRCCRDRDLSRLQGEQHCPGRGRCSSTWSSLFREEFAGSATSASGVWNACTGEGWQELEGEWAPGAAGTPGMGQDTGNATGWQWALNLLCQPVRETCRERKCLVCSSRNSSSSFIFLHLPGATSPMLKDTELL